MSQKKLTVIGLMSGTSVDGIDAALIKTDGLDHLDDDFPHLFLPYTSEFKIALKAAAYVIKKCHGDVQRASEGFYPEGMTEYLRHEARIEGVERDDILLSVSNYFNQEKKAHQGITLSEVIQHSTDLHAVAVNKLLEKTGCTSGQVDLIGYHGQTMFHHPSKNALENKSIIVGNGQSLADQTGIVVINDFRSHDVAMGGQGAPFAPLFHYVLALRDHKIPLVVVNCGGIANVSLIHNQHRLDLIAFDTGAGNGLIDKFVTQFTKGKEHMDKDGQYGKQGIVKHDLLTALYEKSIIKEGENYFSLPLPKSLDIRDLELIPELFSPDQSGVVPSVYDVCATLEAFTADSIVTSVDAVITSKQIDFPGRWVLAGGGWNNPIILQELKTRLNKIRQVKQLGYDIEVVTADDLGWSSQALEAKIFAYLAVRSILGEPLSLPGTTGVSEPVSGGQLNLPIGGATRAVQEWLAKSF